MSNRYTRQGDCRRWCGTACCSLEGYRNNPEFEEIKKDFLEHPEFFGLNDRGECAKLVYKHGVPSCSVYLERPQICKDFPVHPRDIAGLPECGYSFIKQPDPIVPKPLPNPLTAMAWTEEWPLFSTQKHLMPETKEVWIEIDQVPPLKTMAHLHVMALETRRLEWKCWHGGLTGWVIGVAPDNWKVQGLAVTWGAEYYGATEGQLWFRKPIAKAPKGPMLTMQELATGIRTYIRTMRGTAHV